MAGRFNVRATSRTCTLSIVKDRSRPTWPLRRSNHSAGHHTQPRARSPVSSSYRGRTGLSGLKGRCPQSDRRTSRCQRALSTQLKHRASAHLPRSGSGGARIRVSWSSARRYTISATDPNEKSPMSLQHRAFGILGEQVRPVSQAQWITRDGIRRLTGEYPRPFSLFGTQPC